MKFRYKITLYMVSLLALFYGIGGTILISRSFQSALEQEKEAAVNSYQMILDTLQVVNQIDSWSSESNASDILEELSRQNHTSWDGLRLVSGANVLYRSGNMEPFFQDMSRELEPGHCVILQFSDDNQKQYLQISGYVQVGEKELVLDMAYDITSIYENRKAQQDIYYRIYIIMLIICLLVVYTVAYVLTRPLSNLSKATRRIASGNLSYRSMVKTNDEIGVLSEDFNTMAEQVEQSMENMQYAMEQQERFMGSFAHELKTPMTSIIGYADLIRRQTMSEEEEAEAANYIFMEGKRLERLSLKMLDIFSMEQKNIPFSPVSPAYIIEDLAEHLQPVYQKEGIRLDYECESGCCMLEPDLVRSLVLNLADNSRKAIFAQGKTVVQGKNCNTGQILISCTMIPDGCCIVVSDNGTGIPAEAMEHLTEAFYRVDKARSRQLGGAGLGLTLCAAIVELHHGTMVFEANERNGLRVIVELKGGNA